MAQDNIKNLYEALKDDYDLGTEQDFRKSLGDANNRRNLYNSIKDDYDLGTEQDFDTSLGYGENADNISTPAQPTAQWPMSQAEYDNLSPVAKEVANGVGVKPERDAMGLTQEQRQTIIDNVKDQLAKPLPTYEQNKAEWQRQQHEAAVKGAEMKENAAKNGTNVPMQKEPTLEEKAAQGEYIIENARRNMDAPDYYDIERGNPNTQTIGINTKDYTDRLVSGLYAEADAEKQRMSEESPDYSAWGDDNGMRATQNATAENRVDDPKRMEELALKKLKEDEWAIKNNAAKRAHELQAKTDQYIDAAAFADYAYKRTVADTIAKVRNTAVEREKPHNTFEGVMGGLNESIVGNLGNSLTTTPEHIKARQQAADEWRQGAGTWANVGRSMTSFVADTPFFGVSGSVSGAAVEQIAKRQLAKYVARGLSEKAAARVIQTKLANSFGARMADTVMKGVVGQAVNLGSYEGMSEAARQYATQELKPAEIMKKVAHGGFNGAVLGGIGGAWGEATAKLSGASKILSNVFGYGLETGGFTLTGELEKWATGQQDQIHWLQDFGENAAMILAMKAAPNPKNLLQMFNPKARPEANVPKFSDAERNEILSSRGGRELYDLMSEGKSSKEDYAQAYERFVNDPDVSFTSKQKVSYALTEAMQRKTPEVTTYDIKQTEDGKAVLSTRAADGSIVEKIGFSTPEAAEQYGEKVTAAIMQGETSRYSLDAGMAAAGELKKELGISDEEMQKILTGEDKSKEADQVRRAFIDRFNLLTTEREMNDAGQIEEQKGLPETVASNLHEDGTVHKATLYPSAENGGQQQDVFITKGDVVMREDGTVDTEASSDVIYYKDVDGNTHMASPDKFQRAEEPVSAEEVSSAEGETNTSNEPNKTGGTEPAATPHIFLKDEEVKFTDVDDKTYDGVVSDYNGNEITVDYEDAGGRMRRMVVPADELAQMNGYEAEDKTNTAETPTEAVDQPQVNAEANETRQAVVNGETTAAEATATPDTPVTEEQQPTAEAMPMTEVTVGKGKDAKKAQVADYAKATPQRTHHYLYNEKGLTREQANDFVKGKADKAAKVLEQVKKKEPQIGSFDEVEFWEDAHNQWSAEKDAAQAQVDYWNAVKQEQAKAVAAERAAQAEKDAAIHDAAVIEEQQRKEAEAQAAAERAEVGNENPMPHITEKWNAAPKVDGVQDEMVLPNGEKVKGHYVLTESGAATPSHQSTNGFQKSEGFPMDENGNTVNDRDYERDTDAQGVTRNIASQYDSRALQTPVVVSQDGVVLSGNGRTMAGELAAQNKTDTAYNDYVKQYAQKYGFTPEQVGQMQHPRVVFVPDERMPYTADTFAKFNQQEMKSQSKTEQAVKLGKIVDDGTFNRIVRTINAFDTLGDFYNDPKATAEAIKELQAAGVINQQQLAEMYDGDGISAAGREILENTLIGKAFESNPDAVRMITEFKSMRQSVITALSEIANNVGLGKDFSLESELAEAVKLCYNARHDGYKLGERVSGYARQGVLFGEEGETMADYQNATIMMLADLLNDQRVSQLKKSLAVYNNEAHDSANGQIDLFSGSVKDKEQILKDVLNILNYGTNEQQQSAINNAVERRKESVQQNGSVEQGSQGSETAENGGVGLRNDDQRGAEGQTDELQSGITLTAEQQSDIVAQMRDKAEVARDLELTPENWEAEFGETGMVETPIGAVKMGENQYLKLLKKKRDAYFGMIKPTLTNPDMVLEEYDPKEGAERATKYLFVKTFIKADGSRYVHFESVTMQKDNLEVSISSHEINEEAVSKKVHQDKLIHLNDKFSSSDLRLAEPQKEGSDIVPTPNSVSEREAAKPIDGGAQTEHRPADVSVAASPESVQGNISDGKVMETSSTGQEKEKLSADNKVHSPEKGENASTEEAVRQAEQDVNTNPTEAQKEAGNYKKGHVKVDGYDISIEQPKGSVRTGHDADGNEWRSEMHNTYGYIRGTEGVDGDHIDVFLSDNPGQGNVYVIDQVNPKTGEFDEHKVMYGFGSMDEAREAYLSNYSNGWKRLGTITEVSKDEFRKWVDSSHRKTKPFAEYKNVKKGTIAVSDSEQPKPQEGESSIDYAKRLGEWNKTNKANETNTAEEAQKQTKAEDKRKKKNKLGVSEEEKDDALKKLRDMLLGKGGNITAGLDMTTLLEQGGKLARYYVGNGLEKFADFAKTMYEDMAKLSKEAAEQLKPYIKRIYMDLQGDMDISDDIISRMDDNKTVRSFNMETLGKEETPSALDTARELSKEREVGRNADETLKPLTAEQEKEIENKAAVEWMANVNRAMKRGGIPNPNKIRGHIAQLGKRIKTIERGMATGVSSDADMHKAQTALSILRGQQRAAKEALRNFNEKVKAAETDSAKPTEKSTKPVQGDLFSAMEEETKPAPQKPKEELEGNSEEYQRRAIQEHDFVIDIAKAISERDIAFKLSPDAKPMTMNDVKKLAEKYNTLQDLSTTDLQEMVEIAMTKLTHTAALTHINGGDTAQRVGYDKVVSLYNAQPLLNARDSTRVERQQYSTPTPFGYVMGQYVSAGRDIKSVLEPSAGNGALTISFNPKSVHVNDIDERRLANLRTLGYGKVTSQNGLLPFEGEQVDAMLTNPPFGTTTEQKFDNGTFAINSLEGLMAINALNSMKDDGRAAIVIGGNTEYRENGVMKPKDMKFFGYLYSHYNVTDVINLDGEMYARNGTKYPVRIILVDGRKTGEFQRVIPPVKAKARAEQVHTFDELYKRVQDDIQLLQQKPQSGIVSGNGETTTVDREHGAQSHAPSNTEHPGTRTQPIRTSEMGTGGRTTQSDGASTTATNGGTTERPSEHKPVTQLDNGNRGDAVRSKTVQRPNTTDGGRGNQLHSNAQTERGGSGNNASARPTVQPDTDRGRLAVNLTDEKVTYPNRSQSGTLMSVVPANQAQVLADSLEKIGDVDQFLVDNLGYSSKEELYGYLAAEQIDSVALAINQMSKGNAFIIGDMTGVGKGRQGAALIRYAVSQGKKPIYFTQKPSLFADNYRDLCDIGSDNLRPFIIASSSDGVITDAKGDVVYKLPSKAETQRVMEYVKKNGILPDEYDYTLVTYSQIQSGTMNYVVENGEIKEKEKSYKGNIPAGDISGQKRRNMIYDLSRDNYIIMDESHTVAGGSGQGGYMQMLLADGTRGAKPKGVTFLSATFAKRPDNMPLYAMRTALSESGMKPDEMIQAIAQGGVTLQEIMSKQLVQSGQMIRRERSFKGVNIDWMQVDEAADKVQREQFNEVAGIFSAIRAFQDDYIKPLVTQKSDEMAESGSYSQIKKGTEAMGVKNAPFASKMYNLVNQLLFALKADAVADRVIWNLRNGFKPVISFTNTMEGFLEDTPKDTPMAEMPNFSLTLLKALDGVMRYQVTDADANTTGGSFKLSDLSNEGQATYNDIRKRIVNLSANLSISPMDAIKMKIEEAGYKVGEITGRKTELSKDENGMYVVHNRTDRDKKEAARQFNNGGLDVLMINKSGSTGISLHSSPKFADTRQRVMVFAQFQSDINDEVQMRGRIDRTGQKYRGRYEYIMSTIPAEQRLQMMFKAKLKSLDANTTSSQKSKFNEMDVVDYLNKYGDEVTWQYMTEHPELEEKLGDPLNMLDTSANKQGSAREEGKRPQDGCAAKIARYLPFLPVEEQEQVFKDITEAYAVKMQLLNDAGENDLEITTMPLRADTKSKQIWKKGTDPGSGNAFADNTYLEEAEVDVLKKPMKAEEVKAYSSRLSDSKPFDEWRAAKRSEITDFYNNKREALVKKQTEAAQVRAQKAREKYIKDATKAREKGKNAMTDTEITEQADVAAKAVMDEANKKIVGQANAITERRDYLLEKLGDFTPEQPLVIPLDITSEKDSYETTFTPSYGTFLGFKFNKEFSPSSSTAVFATLDGRRKVELPLTKSKALNAILMQTTMHGYEMRYINMGTWDSHVPTKTRKTAYIVTGNLLQALVDTSKGQNTKGYLISYSTKDGETRQGILMPDRFKPSDLRSSAPISSKLDALRNGEKIESEDGKISLEKQGSWSSSGYWLNVPKSKQSGGEYFTDRTLRNLVERGEFETRGNKMRAYVPTENISKVLDRLSKMGVTVLQESNLKSTGNEVHENETIYETRDKRQIKYTSANPAAYGQGVPDRDTAVAGGANDGTRPSDVQRTDDELTRRRGTGLRTDEGEFCHVERVFRESGAFNFTAGEKIESAADVAYIFTELEDAAVENTFAVMVKDGKPTVVHVGVGNFTVSMVNQPVVKLAYDRLQPDKVYFVHNHPSGNVKCSYQDVQVLKNMRSMLSADVEGVIINLKSGKYGLFDTEMRNETRTKPTQVEGEHPIKLYSFDKQVFAPDYEPNGMLNSAEKVAAFVSSHRLGDRKKLSFLVVNNQLGVTANIHTPYTKIDDSNRAAFAEDMARAITEFGGTSAFVYGDFAENTGKHGDMILDNLNKEVKRASGGAFKVSDLVKIEGNNTKSAMYGDVFEPQAEYGDIEEVNKKFNEQLETLTEENADGIALSLGRPSDILRAAGVEDKPMKLYGNKVMKKMRKHGFTLDELQDLPKAVANPIAVFNNYQQDGNRTILTELHSQGRNIMVAVTLGKEGVDIDFNIVSSVFGKGQNNIVNWINKGYLTYANKEKALNYLHFSESGIPEASNNQELVSAANVVRNFENPNIPTEKSKDIGFDMEQPMPMENESAIDYARRLGDWHKRMEDAGMVVHDSGASYGTGGAVDTYWRDMYDEATTSAGFKFREAAQDGMLSVTKLQETIAEETNAPIKDDEDVWALQNRLGSTNRIAQEYYGENYYKPVVSAVRDLVKQGAKYNEKGEDIMAADKDVSKYVIAKHGLERNEVFAQRAFDKYQQEHPQGQKIIDDFRRDYSGLTELFDSKDDYEMLAQDYVNQFESDFDTTDLWYAINTATKKSLKDTYDAGLISREGYETARDMFKYYVPLRGWANDVASEHYHYKGGTGEGGRVVKHAKGRTSLANEPIATIGRMGQDAILQANKNKVKQRLFNLAMNHDTTLLTVRRQWYQNMGTVDNPDWQRVYPELRSDMTADEVADALKDFDDKMKSLKEQGMATQSRKGLTLGYHTTQGQEQQHRVNVSIGGREYNIFVNGNPRAAQAINGELRLEDDNTNMVQKVNRWLSGVYTSMNPEFVISNYERDAGFAASIVAATEPLAYQGAWAKNMAIYNPVTTGAYITHLINKVMKGKDDPNSKVEVYMQEFLFNGGETGYVNMLTVDDYKKMIKKEVKKINAPITPGSVVKVGTAFVERANRVFEDATRFATYVTSREQGRSIDKSIRDAKEISLNFNTRGADGMKGDSLWHKFFRNLRRWIIFSNPSIQGLQKAGVAFKNHPVRSTIMIAGVPALLGYGMAALSKALLGDNDDEDTQKAYLDLPKWTRRTNICIPIGGTKFVTIPLSYELRVSYGMGEMLWEIEQGLIEPSELVKETAAQLSDLLPVSFNTGDVAQNVSPSVVRPLVDITINKDFTGKPIWRENTFNKGMPEYTKVYAGTASWLKSSTEFLNNATGGDKYTPGKVNVNPGKVEHLLNNYLGGLFSFPSKTIKAVQWAMGDEDMADVRNIPIISRNIRDSKSGNPINKGLGDRYNNYMREYQLSKQRFNGYRREAEHGVTEFLPKLMQFYTSPEGKRMLIIDAYKKALKPIDEEVKAMGEYDGYGDKDTRYDLKEKRDSVYNEMVEKLDSISEVK